MADNAKGQVPEKKDSQEEEKDPMESPSENVSGEDGTMEDDHEGFDDIILSDRILQETQDRARLEEEVQRMAEETKRRGLESPQRVCEVPPAPPIPPVAPFVAPQDVRYQFPQHTQKDWAGVRVRRHLIRGQWELDITRRLRHTK